jgi:predicted outer membrane protein
MRFAPVVPSFALFAFLLAFVAPGLAAAQNAPDPSYIAQRSIMLSALSVDAARIARERAQSRDVREFADDAIDRFRGLTNDTREMAEDADLPAIATRYSFGREQQAMLDRLADADGRNVDRAFLDLQDYVARNLTTLFEDAQDARSERIRRFAQNHMSLVRDHARATDRLRDATR